MDPKGSILHDDNAKVATYHVEGIGYDFVPTVLDRSLVDEWVVTDDAMARRLIREEGSSGLAIVGAIAKAKELDPRARCLVILPDSIRNCTTKFLDDDWPKSVGSVHRPTREDGSTPKVKQKARRHGPF